MITVQIGEQTFCGDSVVSITSKQTVDPVSSRLPEAEMVIQLYTAVPLCPQLEEKVTLLVDNWMVQTMFVKECTRVGNCRYRLLTKPRTEYLQTRFMGNIYQGQQVSQVLSELFGDLSERLDSTVIDQESLTGYIAPCTRGEALEQLCFGVGATLCCGAAGELVIGKPLMGSDRVLDQDQMTPATSWRLLPHYSRFELASHEYVKGQVLKTLVDKEEVVGYPATITFTKPYWFYTTGDEYVTEIVEEGTNYVKLYHNGITTIYGKPWLEQTVYHTLPGTESDDPWFSHVLAVRDRTLIGPHNVESRLQELKTLGQMRCLLKAECLITDMGIALRAGDPVTTLYGTGIVVGEKLTLTENKLHQELTVMCNGT